MSRDIRRILTQRAYFFNIVLDDVSITQLTFSREYTSAVEAKQVAQQDSERAKFIVRSRPFCSSTRTMRAHPSLLTEICVTYCPVIMQQGIARLLPVVNISGKDAGGLECMTLLHAIPHAAGLPPPLR